jgi:hypothetical protein
MKKNNSTNNNKVSKNIRFPQSFKGYFWDCDVASLNMDEHHDFVLKRLLQYGGRDALVWVLHNFNRQDVAAFLKGKRCMDLDRKSYLFWTKVSGDRALWK